MTRLLVAEDERELATMLAELLSGEGYDVDVAPDGQAALHLALTRSYDLFVLDRRMPAVDGVELVRVLRKRGVLTPALLLTAHNEVLDRVEGLDAGAQDYVGKPFDVDELLARIRALLRRPSDTAEAADVVSLGDRDLDVVARVVRSPGTAHASATDVPLSEREVGLLKTLAARPSRVFSREELRERVFVDAESDAAVDTYVSYLRRKLGPDVVHTVRGVGYRMGRA